ncbi:MAG TPA: hypothetical protein VFB38_00525 [Chthonomonadaceae bacterium]|nr:hypothetical protein [Chthonomonadaceae bacterium]
MTAPDQESPSFFRRRAADPTAKPSWARTVYEAGFPLLLVAVATVIVSTPVVLSVIVRQREKDIADAPLQVGSAVVIWKSAWFGNSKSALSGFRPPLGSGALFLEFRLNNRSAILNTTDEDKWARTKIGDTITVTYRIGKSGDYYIEDWLPQKR